MSVQARLLGYAQHNVHPQVRIWSDAQTITANLRQNLEGDLGRLESDALAAEFQHHCPVAGASAADYKNRLLRVAGLELLTGVRFRSLDLAQPFVDVIYQSEPVLSLDQLGAVQAALRLEYAVFKPKRLRFYQASHRPPLPGDGDKRLLAAPLRVMLEQPSPKTLPRVHLKEAAGLSFYPDYAAIYAQLHAEHPELIPVARVESEDDLRGYQEGGNLFEILVDSLWAGVCAVFHDTDSGVSGFCFGEIILAPAFRGQGLGSAVQRRLAELLLGRGAAPDTYLFGQIGAVNLPARRTAARVGRLDLGGHVWVDL